MTKPFFFLLFIFLVLCQTNTKFIKTENIDLDLSKKTFEIGSSIHFTDTCEFHFECDCCFGDIFFSSDSTFYSIDYCIDDMSVSEGSYKIKKDNLTLNYSGISIDKVYNFENATDTSVIDYFIIDTLYKPHSINFTVQMCKNKLSLIHNGVNGKSIAIETKKTFNNQIKKLTKYRIINIIDSLKNQINNK